MMATHSRPESCDPFGQRHGSRALAGGQDTAQAQLLPIFVTDGNSYCFKFLRLRRNPEVCDSRTSCFRTLPALSIRGAGQKDRSYGDENDGDLDEPDSNLLYSMSFITSRVSAMLGISWLL